MLGVLQCAAKHGKSCECCFDANLLFPQCGPCTVPDRNMSYAGRIMSYADLTMSHVDVQMVHLASTHSPKSEHSVPIRYKRGATWTHRHVTDIETTRRVEIAIGCTPGIIWERWLLVRIWESFNNWLGYMQTEERSGNLCVVLRLMPASEDVAFSLEQFRSESFVEATRQFYGPEYRWRSEVGEWVLGSEWEEIWDESENAARN